MQNILDFDFHASTKFEEFRFFDIYREPPVSHHKTMITFFTVNDTLDYQHLLDFKQQKTCDFLVAIQTHQTPHRLLTLADNIIFCKVDEVIDVVKCFDMMLADYGFIYLNAYDIKEFLQKNRYLSFIKSCQTGENITTLIDKNLTHVIEHKPSQKVNGLLVNEITPSDFYGFQNHEQVVQAIENSQLLADDGDIFLAVNFQDAENFWQNGEVGHWLGVFFGFNDVI